MNVHFLLSGHLFYWLVIGVDRAPRTLPHLGKLGLLFAAMPFHAFFGVILMNKQTVIAENFYRSLAHPWLPDLLTDQRLGGGIAWATGEVPMLVVVIALLRQWAVADHREASRFDRANDNELSGAADSPLSYTQRNANRRSGSASTTVSCSTFASGEARSPKTIRPVPPGTGSNSASSGHHSRMFLGELTTS